MILYTHSKSHRRFLSEKSQSRIVGGEDATRPYAYQVSLERPTIYGPGGVVYSWGHFCGGSIVSNRHVLTAGFYFTFVY